MLKYTLILPDGDAELAGRLLRDSIDDLDVVLMLVFGTDGPAEQVVEWADKLCNKGVYAEGKSRRHAVWVRKPGVKPVREVLQKIFPGELPFVAVLNFYDEVRATLQRADKIDPIVLERAFLKGYLS